MLFLVSRRDEKGPHNVLILTVVTVFSPIGGSAKLKRKYHDYVPAA